MLIVRMRYPRTGVVQELPCADLHGAERAAQAHLRLFPEGQAMVCSESGHLLACFTDLPATRDSAGA